MTNRIEPTPEDMAIFERNIQRVTRWAFNASKRNPRYSARARQLTALQGMVKDYLHFPPDKEPSK